MTTAELCARAILELSLDGLGISLMTAGGHRGTVYASDEVAARIEELQFTLGEGPCVAAYRSGPVLIDDVLTSRHPAMENWPAFATGVAAVGVRALFAFPLQIGAIRIGALDMYRTRPGALKPPELALALSVASAASLQLLDSLIGSETDADLGVSHHLEVHQATGALSVRLETSLEDAFVRLRAYAFAHDEDINEVARKVLTGEITMADRRATDD